MQQSSIIFIMTDNQEIKPHPQPPQYVTMAEASRLTKVPPPLLSYYINKGLFCEAHEIAGRKHYILGDVLAWEKPTPGKRGRPLGVKNHVKTQEN